MHHLKPQPEFLPDAQSVTFSKPDPVSIPKSESQRLYHSHAVPVRIPFAQPEFVSAAHRHAFTDADHDHFFRGTTGPALFPVRDGTNR